VVTPSLSSTSKSTVNEDGGNSRRSSTRLRALKDKSKNDDDEDEDEDNDDMDEKDDTDKKITNTEDIKKTDDVIIETKKTDENKPIDVTTDAASSSSSTLNNKRKRDDDTASPATPASTVVGEAKMDDNTNNSNSNSNSNSRPMKKGRKDESDNDHDISSETKVPVTAPATSLSTTPISEEKDDSNRTLILDSAQLEHITQRVYTWPATIDEMETCMMAMYRCASAVVAASSDPWDRRPVLKALVDELDRWAVTSSKTSTTGLSLSPSNIAISLTSRF
jgi:hypothetical protein